jgi:Uma2 family endonuclease
MATATSLMTAEEYAALPEYHGYPTELVKGVLITMVPPMPRHGQICARASYLLQQYLNDHDIGQVLTNDSGVITERDPDTVRGADVAYYSYQRVPKGPLPSGLLSVAPELVFEVRSPNERWSKLHVKVAEYLNVGVQVVCVIDDDSRSIHVFHADQEPQILTEDHEFALPEILVDFRAKVRRFFE